VAGATTIRVRAPARRCPGAARVFHSLGAAPPAELPPDVVLAVQAMAIAACPATMFCSRMRSSSGCKRTGSYRRRWGWKSRPQCRSQCGPPPTPLGRGTTPCRCTRLRSSTRLSGDSGTSAVSWRRLFGSGSGRTARTAGRPTTSCTAHLLKRSRHGSGPGPRPDLLQRFFPGAPTSRRTQGSAACW
jgi:hypothetical protein